MKTPLLYSEKKDCCGCRACMNACPMSAITMEMDEYGFYYPIINEETCIGCNKCVKTCSFQTKEETNEPIDSYAAVCKQDEVLKKSASGGVFATLANYIISEKKGLVCGAAYDEEWNVNHILIDNLENLSKLQGSKYVQSNTNTTYKDVKTALDEGRVVLYSGTPCQIAGLNGYLGKQYENLWTVDLVCHGVPSGKMLKDYVEVLQKQNNGKVVDFNFRDKTKGWGINGSCVIQKGSEKKKKDLWQSASSYLYYFSNAYIYRDSCYSCKYASKNRPADLTIGDFWGIERVHPELLKKREWDEKKGISLIVANTEKGKDLIADVSDKFVLEKSTFENVALYNHQLREPSSKKLDNVIMDLYEKEGWESVDERFHKVMGFRKHTSKIKSLIPNKLKTMLKKLKK